MQIAMNATQQAIMEGRSVEKFIIYNSRQMGRSEISRLHLLRYFQNCIKQIKANRALSRFKQNSSYFMYRNVNGAWRNY